MYDYSIFRIINHQLSFEIVHSSSSSSSSFKLLITLIFIIIINQFIIVTKTSPLSLSSSSSSASSSSNAIVLSSPRRSSPMNSKHTHTVKCYVMVKINFFFRFLFKLVHKYGYQFHRNHIVVLY